MTSSSNSTERVAIVKHIAYAIVALAFLAVAALAISQTSGEYELSVGDMSVTVSRQDNFADILEKTVGSDNEETREASLDVMIPEMWLQMLEWEGPFQRRAFAAEVEVLPDAPSEMRSLYVCELSEFLSGKYIMLRVPDPSDTTKSAQETGTVELQAAVKEDVFPCAGGTTLNEMFSGTPVEFGVAPDIARSLVSPGIPDAQVPDHFSAEFVVRPRYLVGATEPATR